MLAIQNISCEFAQYAHQLNLSLDTDREDLAGVLSKSFTCISGCAADRTWVISKGVEKLRKMVFDTKTHTLALQPTTSFVEAWLPNKAWTLLGYEETPGPRNLEGMMLFVAEKLSKLVKLKFGPTDNDTFTKYLLVNYKTVHMGMIYLKEYYRRFVSVPSKDHEEKILERCLNIHDSITASAAFIDGYSTEEIFKLTDSDSLDISNMNELLSLEINAPIKSVMTLGIQSDHKAYIKEVFKKGKDLTFMIYCFKIDAELFPQILVPLSNDLEQAYKNRFNSSNPHLEEFYLKILNNEYFKELHIDVVIQLLSEEEFQTRSQSKPGKEALNYICCEIEQIKKQPISELEQKKHLADKLSHWLTLFPEINQLRCWSIVENFCKTNNVKIPF